MADNFHIARPYAKAAFQTAKATDQLALWSTVLHVLSSAISNNTVQTWLNNPVITKDQWGDFLIGFLNTICKDFSETQKQIENFIYLLIDYQHVDAMPEIFALFQRYFAKANGYAQLSVRSPFVMTEKEESEFKKVLEAKLKTAVSVDFTVDANLIGGLIVRAGNFVLDDSFQNKLKRLKSALL